MAKSLSFIKLIIFGHDVEPTMTKGFFVPCAF